MKCAEAQSLMDGGIEPGSQSPQHARLGFHLAGCPTCRTYRATISGRPGEPSGLQLQYPAAVLEPRRPVATALSRRKRRHPLSVVLALLAGLLLVGITYIGGVLVRAGRNISAMVVTVPPPATLEATPSPPVATPPRNLALIGGELAGSASPTPLPSRTPPAPVPTFTPVQPSTRAATILLLGNDRRPDEPSFQRTDALLLVRLDPQQNRIALLALPRDLWVEVPGYGYHRINAAYMLGESSRDHRGGLGLARDTVTRLLGIPIDYVAMVDFQGFVGLIDTLGGVVVDVEKELYDDRFPTMDYGYTVVQFQTGPQLMDGERALTYSRIRHPDSDFMRIRRQQAVLVAIGTRIRERGQLRNLIDADRITGALVGYVKTDMPRDRIVELLWSLRDYDLSRIERYVALPGMVRFGRGSDRYVQTPDIAAFAALGSQFLSGVARP